MQCTQKRVPTSVQNRLHPAPYFPILFSEVVENIYRGFAKFLQELIRKSLRLFPNS